ncbi:MAG: helix-turn-helix domain-containing protein, partial [Pollutimonas bauzanensis]
MPKKAISLSVADTNPAPGGVAAVDRAISLLAAFKSGDSELTLLELSERSRLYKSTILRLLASLEHGGLVQKTADGRYALGYEVGRLNSVYAAAFSLGGVVMPVLRELVAQTRESAAFHIVRGGHRVCVHRVD